MARKSTVQQLEREVKELRKENAELRQARHRLQFLSSVVWQSLEGIGIVDLEGKVLFVNPAWAAMHGYDSCNALIGKPLSVFHSQDQMEKEVDPFNREVQRHGFCAGEVGHIRRDGTSFPAMMTTTLIKDEERNLIGMVAIARDITEQKQAEDALKQAHDELERRVSKRTTELTASNTELKKEIAERMQVEAALRESEERYRRITEAVTDYIFTVRVVDGQPMETVHSPACIAVIGYSPEDFAADHYLWFHMVYEEDRPAVQEQARRILAGEGVAPIEHRILRKDGALRWIRNTLVPHYDSQGVLVSYDGLIRDITDRKLAEDALRKSEEKYRSLIDHSRYPIMLVDHEGILLLINAAGAENFGGTPADLAGRSIYEFFPGIADLLVERYRQVIESGSGLDFEDQFDLPTGRRWFWLSLQPVFHPTGKTFAVQIIAHDITLSKQAEEEKEELESRLRRAQKMEAIGTLAGGIAHDFNNLLTGIQGNISLMLLDSEPSSAHYERLKSIEKHVQSGAKLTSHLLGYAMKGKYEVKPVDVNKLIEETIASFGRTRKEIRIHLELAENLFAVEADSGQIEQVLLNLFVNAADAMPGGGDLFLQTRNTTHEEIKGKQYEPKPGDYIVLTVADTGIGMDKNTMERIFDPFFTTKEMGHGTGLGLASAYGILKSHGGYIDVVSELGEGATFRIYLPASQEQVQQLTKPASEMIKGSETVLLVDDEGFVLEIGKELMEFMGYRVLTAPNGEEAIRIYAEHGHEIDIVLLDMVMPDMWGGEVYDRLKQLNPDVKVLLSSGYTMNGQATEILRRGCNGFLQKPFTMEQLSRKVREILKEQ
jgi:two-component system cell cycle sensor histidine kinase/response regulator CckA